LPINLLFSIGKETDDPIFYETEKVQISSQPDETQDSDSAKKHHINFLLESFRLSEYY